MLTRRVRCGAWAVALAAFVVLGAGCGEVVETGPSATPGEGFEEIVLEAPATTAPDSTAAPGSTMAPSEPTGTTAPAGTTAPTPSTGVLFPPGTCLTWDQTGATPGFEVVSCDLEHLAEVAGGADLSEAFGPDAPYPTDDELRAVVSAACSPIVLSYLGRELAAMEEPGVISPSDEGWAQGERVVYCTVGLGRQDGQRPAYTGTLASRPPG